MCHASWRGSHILKRVFVQHLQISLGIEIERTNARLLDSACVGLYHSSKAAVTILSETLRLELAPLGVTVITGMLGSIESNIHVNDSWQGVPESSRYKSAEAQIAKQAEGMIGPKKEKVEDFARRFADDILKGASGQVWRGAMAQTTRALGYHAPMSLLVCDFIVLQNLFRRNNPADYGGRIACSCPEVDWILWQRTLQKSRREKSRIAYLTSSASFDFGVKHL